MIKRTSELRLRRCCFRFVVALLAQARLLADTAAQEVQLGAAHLAVPQHLHFVEARRVHYEGALNADAMRGEAAHREALRRTMTAQAHHHTLKGLKTLAV